MNNINDVNILEFISKLQFIEMVIIIFIIVVLIVAIICSIKDFNILNKQPSITKNMNDAEKIQILKNLSCYARNNNVGWRFIFIATLIVSFLLCYIFNNIIDLKLFFLILIMIFLTFYLFHSIQSFHVSRVVCAKATNENGEYVISS